MTDIDAFRDDEDDENAAAAEKEPTLFYGSADEFVRERLRYMYARRVGPVTHRSAGLHAGGTTLKLLPRRCPVARLGAPALRLGDRLKHMVD